MSKKFDIREWFQSVKYWLLLFIPHLSICLIYLIYILIGAIIIQGIEIENYLLIKNFQKERERFLTKIIEKSQTLDLQQYTKYLYKHTRQYEEEIKKLTNFEENSSWNFSKSLFIISTSLTTIGSNEFIPKTTIGKLFVMIYIGFGIPLTLVFITDLSYLIKQLIKYISLIIYYFYSSNNLIRIRRFILFRFIEKQFNIFIDEDELNTSKSFFYIKEHIYNICNLFKDVNNDNDLTLIQLFIILFIYMFIGTYLIPSKSFLESFYLCFTIIFTINLNSKINEENNFIFIIIYLFIALAIVLLCIKTMKIKIDILLTNIGKKLLSNLMKFSQQIGLHDLNTDDSLADTDMNSYHISESGLSQHRHLTRTSSSEQQLTVRPIGIAEPLRRLSTGLIRAFKSIDNDYEKKLDKSVQVSTIIRRCGRCAEITLPILPLRRHCAISTSPSSATENNSSCEDDDVMDFPPPNLDRIRRRRATLVAKTIINQMATQARTSSIEEFIPPLTILPNQRRRLGDSSPIPSRYAIKISPSTPPGTPIKRKNSQEEFAEISKQISALLTPSDDEN